MRIALVSPYSWSHPGGVTRHIEALAAELTAAGHEPRVIAPFDGEPGSAPEMLVSLGPTLGWSFNGAKSNIANTPLAAATLRRELRDGRLRRRPPARAGRAADRLDDARARARAGRRHLPHLLAPPAAARGRVAMGREPQHEPPAGADRRVRGRGVDRPALLRRRVPDRAQRRDAARRRRAPAAAARAGRAARDRVRRPGRRAQGPAGAAARLRGAARAACPRA